MKLPPLESEPKWATGSLVQILKDWLCQLGQYTPSILIRILDSSLHYLEAGRWMKSQGFCHYKKVKTRTDIFDQIALSCQNKKLLYLEFGVFEGKTINYFSQIIQNSDARFHGFDSFVGLPENWNPFNKAGHFSTDGNIPKVDDPRVQFFKGWFSESLKSYSLPDHEVLVLNIDSDLYSSATTVLKALSDKIKIGTLIYFDEFYDRHHEMRAFQEFLEATGYKFECLITTRAFANVLFRRIA